MEGLRPLFFLGMHMDYVALQSFEHYRTYRKCDTMARDVSPQTLEALEAKGLIGKPAPAEEPKPVKKASKQ